MAIIPDWEASKIKYNNYELFPNHYRMLICGSSGDGKSVILQRLLLTKMLDYDIVFLNTPSIHQMEYKIMTESLNSGLTAAHIFGLYSKQKQIHDPIYAIQKLSKTVNKRPTVKIVTSSDVESIPVPEELANTAATEFQTINKGKVKPKTIVIVDDAICSSQKTINKLFTYGRTFSINVIYLTQDFFATGKRECRSNVNTWILFRQPINDLRTIFTRMSTLMTLEEFINFCNTCWDKKDNFVLITKTRAGVKCIDGTEVTNEITRRQNLLYSNNK